MLQPLRTLGPGTAFPFTATGGANRVLTATGGANRVLTAADATNYRFTATVATDATYVGSGPASPTMPVEIGPPGTLSNRENKDIVAIAAFVAVNTQVVAFVAVESVSDAVESAFVTVSWPRSAP